MADLRERIDAAIKRITDGHGSMRVPADPNDPDLVLADCKAMLEHLKTLVADLREQKRIEARAGEERTAKAFKMAADYISDIIAEGECHDADY